MDITFLIGNGFDLNLGLKTSYSDFVKVYKKTESKNENIKCFKENMEEDKELWKDAELALGRYTEKYFVGEAELFFECQLDFAKNLAKYLKEQTRDIDYDPSTEKIVESFGNLTDFISSLPTKESRALDTVFQLHSRETWKYNFINFNYTNTMESCIDLLSKIPSAWGRHKSLDGDYLNRFEKHIHIHGTVDEDMIIGVNDDTQVAKHEIFDCENGDMYKSMIIKPLANESYMQNNDEEAQDIIKNSNIIFVYGMSIGDTDGIWWERIIKWVVSSYNNHLIIYNRNIPVKEIIPLVKQIHIKNLKNAFLERVILSDYDRRRAMEQIHITDYDVFKSIKDIGKNKKEGQLSLISD